MRDEVKTVVMWVLRGALAAIYLLAAIPKILDPWSFTRAIHNFRILPVSWIPPLAITLPTFEALAAVAVITGFLYRGGALALTLFSLAFAGGIGSAIARGLDIDCGCFGSLAKSSASVPHLLLNLGTAAAGIILLAWSRRHSQKRRLLH
jgi:putative oxidoreductase